MDKVKYFRWKFFLLIICTFIFLCIISVKTPVTFRSNPGPYGLSRTCPFHVFDQTITPLKDTKHLLVSAFMDQRVQGFDIRIIGLFRIDSIQPLHCRFCCAGFLSITTPANILQHPEIFGFPFVTTDVMCPIPENCNATHVTLLTQPESGIAPKQIWLPIRNRKTNMDEEEELQFNFTVCISSLFADYNNVLQFAQTLEMYRLLGVGRVVIYNTSCGPELERLLQIYSQDGFLEIVPWPIHQHLNPSKGWLFSEHGGDVHYFGQLATLNECIYRSMERSRYVLLNDIDEIIMPYQHDNLMSMMNMLQEQHPNAGVFIIENHFFPKKPFEGDKPGPLPQWRGVPGFNIMEHIYREEPDRTKYLPNKLIVKPRAVEQTSVHEVLKQFNETFKVPMEVCRIINCRMIYTKSQLELLHVDTRLWDFSDDLLTSVMKMLRRAGLLSSEVEGRQIG
ncbi:uncharacterized protein LOC117756456 [Hippoglossus hippoglossus]|uniref:uncharacterized protein LOC117756456 n=2 Tax=Hippoglossus hippoglossus TaxID=8267 RepID=UPI00148D27BA|nr:uncharacterized protein LOC117756456 [Hippoglossus hippoglossus]